MSFRFMVNCGIIASLLQLNEFQSADILSAILDYVESDGEKEPTDLDGIEHALWILIRNELDRENCEWRADK